MCLQGAGVECTEVVFAPFPVFFVINHHIKGPGFHYDGNEKLTFSKKGLYVFTGNLLLYVSLVVTFKDRKACRSIDGNHLIYFFLSLALKHEPNISSK